MGVISSRQWRFLLTRTAGAFPSDTVLGPDLPLSAAGLWMVEWYAFLRVDAVVADNSVTYRILDGATTIYLTAKNIGVNKGDGPSLHRILIAVPNATHVAQVETNSGIVLGNSYEVSKGAQLLGTLRETQALGFIDEITRDDLLALRGWW